MEPRQLLDFLNRIYVWIPRTNPMRNEILNVMNQLRQQMGMPPK
jgi:hypothetical protein